MAGKKKGSPKTGGRKKGTPNVMTRDVREMILTALQVTGGVDYLVEQSRLNPASFLTLVGKVLPTRLEHNFDNLSDAELVQRAAGALSGVFAAQDTDSEHPEQPSVH